MKFKLRYLIYGIIGLVIILISVLLKFNVNTTIGNSNIVAVDFKNDMKIEKSFTSLYNDLNKIGIKFATYMSKNNQGVMNVRIIDNSNNLEIYNQDIKLKNIVDNEFYYFDFNNQKESKNKEYKIIIKVKEMDDDTNIGIWGDYSLDEMVKVDAKAIDKDYVIMVNGKNNDYKLLLCLAFYGVIIAMIEILKENGGKVRK